METAGRQDPRSAYFAELSAILVRERPNKQILASVKRRLCRKHGLGVVPSDVETYGSLTPADASRVREVLATKPVRTGSGVTVVAVAPKPHPCPHGTCTFCPGGPGSAFGDLPQSHTDLEPGIQRSVLVNYDPYLAVMGRLSELAMAGHLTQKIELLFQGGTFTALPIDYQRAFVKGCFQALNDFSAEFHALERFDLVKFREFFEIPGAIGDRARLSRIEVKLAVLRDAHGESFEAARDANEDCRVRCVGLTVETKPEWALTEHGNRLLDLGCTRVELGVQSPFDSVLERVNRGHTVRDTRDAVRDLRDLGFKLNFHVMPGLPGASPSMDREAFALYFDDPDFRPDMLKIYPCLVVPGTPLYDSWRAGEFVPLTDAEAVELLADVKPTIPEYCRVMRIQREIPAGVSAAGVGKTNLRQAVAARMAERGTRCRCIRCREPKQPLTDGAQIDYRVHEYEAAGGIEFFLSANAGDTLLGFLRLRVPSRSVRAELSGRTALVREVHVYGRVAALGESGARQVQHRGIGAQLLHRAESLASARGRDKVAVIAGVGARGYFRRFGYEREGPYMTKRLGP